MMETLFVNNTDVYAEFGVCLTEGSYGALISYPSQKKPDRINDWAEEDGEDVDLTSLELLPREFDLTFAAKDQEKVGEFIRILSAQSYCLFHFETLKKDYALRLVSQSAKKLSATLETFSLRFSNDFPNLFDPSGVPSSDLVSQRGYILDAKDLSEYGVYVLNGSDAEILKLPEVKKNVILTDITNDPVKYRSKNVSLSCLMLAKDIDEFWRNYEALLTTLVQDGPRNLYYEKMGEEYWCYYNSSTVTKFSITDRVWCQFTLSLTFTSFGVSLIDDSLLATENDELIETEQGKNFINLNV